MVWQACTPSHVIVCGIVTCRDPLVIPFYHSGMARIMPEHGRIPRVGQTVAVTVGMPIDLSDLTCRCSEGNTKVCSLISHDEARLQSFNHLEALQSIGSPGNPCQTAHLPTICPLGSLAAWIVSDIA